MAPKKKEKCIRAGCTTGRHKDTDICKKHYSEENKGKIKTNVDGVLVKFCTKCADFFDESGFRTMDGKVSTRCGRCLTTMRRAEAKRPERDRKEQYKLYDAQPERKEMKKNWRKDNHEKCAKYTLDYRARRIEEDEEEYLRKQAEYKKKWRAKNPEKMQERYRKDKLDPRKYLYTYKYSAETKGIKWELTDKQAYNMFKKSCYYCNGKSVEKLTGIDRLMSNKEYTAENTVPCCKLCNYMKNTLNPHNFVRMAIHIATFNKLFKGELYPEVFTSSTARDYEDYKERALSKEWEFDLTEDEYDEITNKSCYLCGKIQINGYCNGIDRIDSNKGYVDGNMKASCKPCNIMKREFEYIDFLCKVDDISKNWYSRIDELDNNYKKLGQCRQTVRQKSNRNRTDELANKNKESRQKLLNPEYRKNHAKNLATQKLIY